jgi:ABC-type nitrate/sulfonate/bicarbonate transport system substrate-binding protein
MRPLCALILTCLIGVACTGQTPTPKSIPLKSGTIRYFHILNVDIRYIPTLMALDDLQAQGYKVERTQLTSSALIADALTRGDADIGSLNPQTMWTAIAKGANARSFMLGLASPNFIIAKPEIKSCVELDGSRIASSATSGLLPTMFDLYVKKNCPNARFNSMLIVDTDSREAALLAGQIDAGQFPLEAVLDLERRAPGKFARLVDYSREFPELLQSVLNLRVDWAKQNPEILKDFIRALLNAHRRINANPQLLYDETVKRLGADPASAKESGDAWLKLGTWDPNGGLTRESIQYTMDFLVNIKTVPAGLGVDDVADLSYLNQVLNEIGRK